MVMQNFESITKGIVTFLKADEIVASNNKITFGYSITTLPNPLRKIYTVVKPQKMTVEENTEEGSSNTKVILYTIGLSLHKAEGENPSNLLSKFSSILEAFEESTSYTVYNAGFNELKRDADSNSVILPAYITFKMYY